MGKLAVKRYISLMFLIIQLVLSIFTFVGLFGGDSNPVGHTASAMLVYISCLFSLQPMPLCLFTGSS